MKSLLLAIVAASIFACPLPSAAESPSFRRDIAPILLDNCLACHGPKKVEGGYRVDTFSHAAGEGDSGLPGITAGDLDDSEVYRRVVSTDIDERMPLDGDQLREHEIALLKRWIEGGASFNGDDPDAPLSSILPHPQHPDPPARYPRPIPVTALQFSADGAELFANGYHEVTVWSVNDGHLRRRIKGVDERTLGLALSPDAKSLAVAGGTPGRRGEVRLFEVATGILKEVLCTSSDMVLDVQYSPDGSRLAAATADNRAVVVNITTGREELVLTSHSDWLTAVAWSSDGTKLASTSRDKTVKVFDANSGDLLATYPGHGDTVNGVAFHPAGKMILSSGGDNRIHQWNLEDAKKVADVEFAGDIFKIICNDEFVFAGSADKTVRQYNIPSLKEVRRYSGHGDWILSIAHHAPTHRLAAGGYNGEIRVWDSTDGTAVQNFFATPGQPNAREAPTNEVSTP